MRKSTKKSKYKDKKGSLWDEEELTHGMRLDTFENAGASVSASGGAPADGFSIYAGGGNDEAF